MIKIGSPLFILRDECNKDLMKVIDRLAEIGFEGIEFLGLFGHSPADVKRKLDSCGISAVGDHIPFSEFADNTSKVIDAYREIGCSYLTLSSPPADMLPGGSNYPKALEIINRIGETVNNAGMTLLYHNHAEEARTMLNDKSILEHIADNIDPDILSLELDLGWIGIAGAMPEYYLNKYKNRCPVAHFKDYSFTEDNEGFIFRPTGYGILNCSDLLEMTLTFDKKPDWYIMDHDCAYNRDIFNDLAMSLEYFRNLEHIVNS